MSPRKPKQAVTEPLAEPIAGPIAAPAPAPTPPPAPAPAPTLAPAPAPGLTSAAEPAPTPAGTTFRISRRKPGESEPRLEDFEIAVAEDATVLDALIAIRATKDPSLVVRHSCMHGSCGTCGMRINGREALACDTKIGNLRSGHVRLEPLANQRLVADLATDMTDFYARFEAAGMPLVRDSELPAHTELPDGIAAFGRLENCIECGLCLSACPIARTNHDYIGPAALAAAARVVEEPRGRDLSPVRALAAERDSVWSCRDAMECSAVCPAGVEPARAILTLRRHVAADGIKRLFGRGSRAGS